MPVPGDLLVARTSLIDTSGSPVLGATFTTVALGADGLPMAPEPVVELGYGVYEFSIQTTLGMLDGTYYLQATSNGAQPQVKEFEWTVRPIGTNERWSPGNTVSEYITVIDPDGNPVLGDTFISHGFNTKGQEFPVPAPAEIGNGVYRVSIATNRFDPSGTYYIQLTSRSLPTQVYEVEFTLGQPVNLIGGSTLLTLRRRVMARFGDIVVCKATQDGSDYSFIDEDNLVGEPGLYAGREALFTSGANAGQKRRITGSSRDTSGVQFQRALPYPTVAGDECDITNAYGLGITFSAVEAAINYAIDVARSRAHVPVNFSEREWEGSAIPIPPGVVGINDVYGIDKDGQQHRIRKAGGRNNGWFVDQSNRQVIINGSESRSARGYEVVINARALPNLLTEDSDVTHIDSHWLIEQATAHLCLDTMLSRQATGEWGSKGMLYQRNADNMITRLTPNIGVNYTAVQSYG